MCLARAPATRTTQRRQGLTATMCMTYQSHRLHVPQRQLLMVLMARVMAVMRWTRCMTCPRRSLGAVVFQHQVCAQQHRAARPNSTIPPWFSAIALAATVAMAMAMVVAEVMRRTTRCRLL